MIWPLNRLAAWRERRKAAAVQSRRQMGYDYAFNQLESGTSVEYLEALIGPFDVDDFDRGMLDAIRNHSIKKGTV